MAEILDSDYVVIGAGGMGMAFTDEIFTQTSNTVTIVDRNHRPGGHWNDAYPFVRLHQASSCYGVNSVPLGKNAIDQVGWNKGCYELASGAEVVAYFDQLMREHYLPSGRIRYLPMTEYTGDGRAVSRVSGKEYALRAKKKVVDATYMNVTVPAQRPPKFDVRDGAVCTPPNALPKLAVDYRHFVIVGSGKTGIDACLFLLEHGTDPSNITWVMPNDAWLFDRFSVNPGRKFTDNITQGLIRIMEAALEADNMDDYFQRVMEKGELLVFDPKVKPTRWRCATVTKLELEQIQRIRNVVRMGHVKAVAPGRIDFGPGSYDVPGDAVFVDCAADGLQRRPARTVFDGDLITLQAVRMCQQVYSAAFIANVEVNIEDVERKNALCRPVPQPYDASDYLRCAIQNSENLLEWITEPVVVKWINESRIDLFSPYIDFEDPEVRPHIEAMGTLLENALPRLKRFLDQENQRTPPLA